MEESMQKNSPIAKERLMCHVAELLYEEDCINKQELQKLKSLIIAGNERDAKSRDL